MKQPLTLTAFMQATGDGIHIYDMGRRIGPIPLERFHAFEACQHPWPQPLQQQAWFATLFQPAGEKEPLIWFLRLPLDEQGKLIPAARDELLQILLAEGLEHGNKADRPTGSGNPYSFHPRDDRLAVFHAHASTDLGHPPSRYYDHARQYLSGELGWDQWPFVGLQGIADVAARLDKQTADSLAMAIPELPHEPFVALCQCLENSNPPASVTLAIDQRLAGNLGNIEETTAAIRGTALSNHPSGQRLVQRILDDPVATHPEVLAALSARAWERLKDATVRERFLERLAENRAGQPFFDQCLADLLFLPGMRAPLMESLRRQDRPPSLEQAVGRFFQNMVASPPDYS